jgi:curved DNA-binding protein CbpA
MDRRALVFAAAAQLDHASYYDMLRVSPGADRSTLQQAWHRFALAYHPDRFVDAEPEVRAAATKVYERGVEAYTVLRDPNAAAAYDRALAQGNLRLPTSEFERLARQNRLRHAKPPNHPPTKHRMAADVRFANHATTTAGREVAERIDMLIEQHRYHDAYLQAGLLETVEPNNPSIRLQADKLARLMRHQR